METNNKENENNDTLVLRTPSPSKRHNKRTHDEAGEPLGKPGNLTPRRKKRRSSVMSFSFVHSWLAYMNLLYLSANWRKFACFAKIELLDSRKEHPQIANGPEL